MSRPSIASRPNLNGAIPTTVNLKNRPRIPTPDVTKEGMEKENRFNLTPVAGASSILQPGGSGIVGHGSGAGNGVGGHVGAGGLVAMGASNIAAGVALAARKLATEPSVYPSDAYHLESPIANLLLSPIKELDSGSVNNTLHPGSPTTVELARALQAGGGGGGQFGSITTTTSKRSYISPAIRHHPAITPSVGFSVAIPNSPSLTRITVFPTSSNGGMSPTSHEVSVAITTLPVVTSRSNNPSHNVIISEVSPDSVGDVDDTIDFGRPSAYLQRQNSDGASSVQHATLRQSGAHDSSASAPSTLAKAKTGEVYV